MLKKYMALLLAVLMLTSFGGYSQTAEAEDETVEAYLIEDADNMFAHGNLDFDISADDLLRSFAIGDIVTVLIEGYETLDVPVCVSYMDVPVGQPLLMALPQQDCVTLAINYGRIGIDLGILDENPDDSKKLYTIKSDVKLPLKMTVMMKEKGGYADQLIFATLIRPNSKEEYAGAYSDEQFANFRVISTTGMGENVLYRSSSPIDAWGSRNEVADMLSEKAGIRTFINLANSESQAIGFNGYEGSYYSKQNVCYCNMSLALKTQAFTEGLAKGLRYMTTHEKPYLIHCAEGKDRTGLVAAVLELFMGASMDEVKQDYLASYENYYAELKDGTVQLDEPLKAEICDLIENYLEYAYEIDDISTVDTVKVTEEYLLGIGLSAEELAKLRECLS